MEKFKDDKVFGPLITLAAKLIRNPNDETLKQDPLFIEKKALILELFEILMKPKVCEEGDHKYAFPLIKEQKELKAYYERITGADRIS